MLKGCNRGKIVSLLAATILFILLPQWTGCLNNTNKGHCIGLARWL